MTPEQIEKAIKIARYYGRDAQDNQLIEECAELIQAVNKYRRYFDDEEKAHDVRRNLLEEIADVEIMIEQIKYLHFIDDAVMDDYIEYKLNRTLERIGVEK